MKITTHYHHVPNVKKEWTHTSTASRVILNALLNYTQNTFAVTKLLHCTVQEVGLRGSINTLSDRGHRCCKYVTAFRYLL